MRVLIVLMAFALVGCGKNNNQPNNIDPTFQPLYDQFISDANQAGVGLNSNQGMTIQFSTLEQTTNIGEIIGECMSVGWGNSTINIDRNYWNSADVPTKQILLYHELGHCVLDEVHTTDKMAIMNALINNPQSYDTVDMPEMVGRLFTDRGDGG